MNFKLKSFVILVIILSICTLSGCDSIFVPHPQIKTGEFNFSVTYEYAGEVNTISGVYVCEFEGIDWAIDTGFHREWTGYIKDNTTEDNIVLGVGEDGGIVELGLFFDPARFMGDYFMESDEPFFPVISVRIYGEGLAFESDADLIAETYGAKIISYEYDAPIDNKFN